VFINVELQLKVDPKRLPEILKFLNLLNKTTINYQYAVCPKCLNITISSALYVPGDKLPKEKFKKLLSLLLEETYHSYPLIDQLLFADGCTPEILFDCYVDDQHQYLSRGGELSEEMKNRVIREMQTELNHLKLAVGEGERIDKGFMFQYSHPQDPDLKIQVGTILYELFEAVVITVSVPLIVPDEKKAVMTELINRINRICGADHVYSSDETKRTTLLQGILLINGSMDAEEFRETARLMMGRGNRIFPVVRELLESDETPETLMNKIVDPGSKGESCCH
jgi:hypothetical protein